MDDRKGYVNTDELQADDEISPRPARHEHMDDGSQAKKTDAKGAPLHPHGRSFHFA